jgi:hypothetical protein
MSPFQVCHPQADTAFRRLAHWAPAKAAAGRIRRSDWQARGFGSGKLVALIGALTQEQKVNYVPPPFFLEVVMFRAVMEEAAALASISLFLGTIAIWAQLFSNF